MKITFVYIAFNELLGTYSKLARAHSLLPPLGVIQLASWLRRAGHEVRVVDTQVFVGGVDELVADILQDSPGAVGISSLTPNFHLARDLAQRLKRARPGLPTLIGGVHFTLSSNSEFYPEFEYGVRGEGELAVTELLKRLESGADVSDIPGLTYRKDGKPVSNPQEFGLRELDEIPYPNWAFLPMQYYRMTLPDGRTAQSASIATARGCPYVCAFCAEPKLFGKRYKVHSAKRMADELEHVRDSYGIRHFFFFDSTLTLRAKLLAEMCEEIIRRGMGITFEGYTRVDRVDEDLFVLMKKAGLVRISLGIESADQEVLRLIRKKIDLDNVRRAFAIMRKLDIEAQSFAMIGNPGDTPETIRETVRFIRSVDDIAFSNLSIAVPYPGTELYEMAANGEHGMKLLSHDYRQYNRYERGVLEVNGMGPEELGRLQKKYLIYMNLTPRRILTLVNRFGFWNLLGVGARAVSGFAADWARAWFGGSPKASPAAAVDPAPAQAREPDPVAKS